MKKLFFFLLLCMPAALFARQDSARAVPHGAKAMLHAMPAHTEDRYSGRLRDTVHFSRALAEKHNLTLTDSALNEIGIDSLLSKVENVHNTLSQIVDVTSVGFDTQDIDNNLPQVDSNIDVIDENLSLYNSVLDVKNLQMFDILLTDIKAQVSDWRNTLFKYNKELTDMTGQMAAFKKDTILRSLFADSAFKSLYAKELTDLRGKWKIAKVAASISQTKINALQANVSSLYFEDIDLQNRVNGLFRKVSVKSLGKEYPYLWQVQSTVTDDKARQLARKSYQGQRRILRFYFQRNWDDQLYLLLTGIALLAWIWWNYRTEEQLTYEDEAARPKFKYIKRVPLLATLVVLCNIAPLFDIHPPTAYVEIVEFLLVIMLTIFLKHTWSKERFRYWVAISALYIVFTVTGVIFAPNIIFRSVFLLLNIGSVVFGLRWLKAIKKEQLSFAWMIKAVSVIYIILNIAAVACIIFGRLSLAKIFSVTAIFGLTQVVGLAMFIDIIMEAISLQTAVIQARGGFAARFNFTRIQLLLCRALTIIAVVIWLIVFTISLNMYNALVQWLTLLLTTPRKIGSTTFEIGSIVLFIIIIYISNLLQQGIGSLYGKDNDKWDPEVKKNGSRLAMTRLFLIVIGFLIAVAASGLPVDKITIVLGALGVGIGLGLQSIVNNLVSGVILIFEQPFRIGDFIQLGDQKGRVLDIGIRSSKMVMEEGAEIIMPNADLLSGRVINWTLHNDNVRIDIPLAVVPGRPYDEVQKIILEELKTSDDVLKDPAPDVLLVSLTTTAMNIDILIWITDVHRIQVIRSEVLNKVYSVLARNEIKIV